MRVDLLVQPTNDPDAKVYHVRDELVTKCEAGIYGELGEESSELMKLFCSIKGIVGAKISPYSVLLCKGSAFEWSEVEPLVERMLTEYIRSQGQLRDAVGS